MFVSPSPTPFLPVVTVYYSAQDDRESMVLSAAVTPIHFAVGREVCTVVCCCNNWDRQDQDNSAPL